MKLFLVGLLFSFNSMACLYDYDAGEYQTRINEVKEQIEERCEACFNIKLVRECKKAKKDCFFSNLRKIQRQNTCQNNPLDVSEAWSSCED